LTISRILTIILACSVDEVILNVRICNLDALIEFEAVSIITSLMKIWCCICGYCHIYAVAIGDTVGHNDRCDDNGRCHRFYALLGTDTEFCYYDTYKDIKWCRFNNIANSDHHVCLILRGSYA
jgi:hypothetical protein